MRLKATVELRQIHCRIPPPTHFPSPLFYVRGKEKGAKQTNGGGSLLIKMSP